MSAVKGVKPQKNNMARVGEKGNSEWGNKGWGVSKDCFYLNSACCCFIVIAAWLKWQWCVNAMDHAALRDPWRLVKADV